MLGLLLPFRKQGAHPAKRKFLRLESLETRDQPDGGLGNPPASRPAGVVAPPINQDPVIVDFSAVECGNGYFVVSGRVIDESPDGMIVTLGGSTSASGMTITVAADGTFSKVIQLRTDGTDSGYITAITTDDFGRDSAEVEYFVDPTPP
jgi:hypothetical protein